MHPSIRFLFLLAALALSANAGQGPLAAALQPFVDHHTVAGAVMFVASKDKVLDLETVGFADLEANKPMAPDSVFWIASMTKRAVGEPRTAMAMWRACTGLRCRGDKALASADLGSPVVGDKTVVGFKDLVKSVRIFSDERDAKAISGTIR